jgi:hypothetical protein
MRWAAVLLASLSGAAAADDRAVDVALVLAVDISLSMDAFEQRAQREGYVAAMSHPAVHDAIARGRLGRVAIAYLEWGGPVSQRVVVPWTVIATADEAARFGAELGSARYESSRGTSISAALRYAARLFDDAPPAERRVIDISGDGPNNMGGPVLEARAAVLAEGVEINGLPLMLGEPDLVFSVPDLDIYYEECVIGGPTAFVVPVLGVDGFATAIRQKLVMEIAGLPGPVRADGPGERPTPVSGRMDCLIGEKLYERWRRRMDWN